MLEAVTAKTLVPPRQLVEQLYTALHQLHQDHQGLMHMTRHTAGVAVLPSATP